MGVQFEKLSHLTSLHATKIRDLFLDDFPNYEEHPPLEPNFETFGGHGPEPRISVQVGPPISRPRIWFVSKDGTHLFQVQEDRFILNWRNINDQGYPHFEGVLPVFLNYLRDFDTFCKEEFGSPIGLTQYELTYINLIEVSEFGEGSEWLKIWSRDVGQVESFSQKSSHDLSDENGNRYARYRRTVKTVIEAHSEKKAIQLDLMVRGKPTGKSWDSAERFLVHAREMIVTDFDNVTTQQAHKKWERK